MFLAETCSDSHDDKQVHECCGEPHMGRCARNGRRPMPTVENNL